MKNRLSNRQKRHTHIRVKLSGTAKVPRVSVYRSIKRMYIQLIDDVKKQTLIGISDTHINEKNKILKAKRMGKEVAEKAKMAKISRIVFDRGGYAYHGRVKSLAEGMREGGLQF